MRELLRANDVERTTSGAPPTRARSFLLRGEEEQLRGAREPNRSDKVKKLGALRAGKMKKTKCRRTTMKRREWKGRQWEAVKQKK